MKIIILSNSEWDNSNNFGNTFTNLFDNIENIEIANIYCRYGKPNNSIVKRYFQITEKSLIANLKNRNISSGKEIFVNEENYIDLSTNERKSFNKARCNKSELMFFIRDFIWNIGCWKSKELMNFIDDFKPDIIYLPLYYSGYLCDIGVFLKEYLQVPMIGLALDDIYRLGYNKNRFSFGYIRILFIRRKLRKLIKSCEFVDTFTNIQKNEYEKEFKIPFKLRLKSSDLSSFSLIKEVLNDPIKIIFTGNIGSGRWQTLALIGNALREINKNSNKALLYIYTTTPMTKEIVKALSIENTLYLMGGVPASEIKKIQESADILLHVEGFNKKDILEVKMSFSTKIVDYLSRGRCLLAVGPSDVASIDYLVKNDAAYAINDVNNIKDMLEELLFNENIIKYYAKNAWECGKNNHQANVLKANFYKDLISVLK